MKITITVMLIITIMVTTTFTITITISITVTVMAMTAIILCVRIPLWSWNLTMHSPFFRGLRSHTGPPPDLVGFSKYRRSISSDTDSLTPVTFSVSKTPSLLKTLSPSLSFSFGSKENKRTLSLKLIVWRRHIFAATKDIYRILIDNTDKCNSTSIRKSTLVVPVYSLDKGGGSRYSSLFTTQRR